MKKTIVITGVGRGLGLAMAQEFISSGHTVIGCSRSPSSIASLQEEYGTNHHFSSVDVADDLAVKNWAEEVLGKYPPPDLLELLQKSKFELSSCWLICRYLVLMAI